MFIRVDGFLTNLIIDKEKQNLSFASKCENKVLFVSKVNDSVDSRLSIYLFYYTDHYTSFCLANYLPKYL